MSNFFNFYFKVRGRGRATVLIARPAVVDEIISSSLPYLPEAIPSSAFRTNSNRALVSKNLQLTQFDTQESMSICFFDQISCLSKSTDVHNALFQNFQNSISLAAAYRDKYRKYESELEILRSENAKLSSQNSKLSNQLCRTEKKLDVLETQFSPKQLSSIYFESKSIESLPEETSKGVLKLKYGKGKWKKLAVALLDVYFVLYDFNNVSYLFIY